MNLTIGMPEILVICSIFFWEISGIFGGIILFLGIVSRLGAFLLEYQQQIEVEKSKEAVINEFSQSLASLLTGKKESSSMH